MSSKNGFTLIELSIVLVIVGLIVGGVLVGRDLIVASQIRAQISQFEKFNQAVNTFKSKYNCLPGDCANFTSFFSSFSPAAVYVYTGPNPTNGNGDGLFTELINGGCCNTTGYPYEITTEPLMFWMMLFTAGLTHCCDPTKSVFNVNTIGVNLPKDTINGFGISVGTLLGRNGYYWGVTTNASSIPNANDYLTLAPYTKSVITPTQAKNLDSKIDNGLASTGNVYAAWTWGGDNMVHALGYDPASACTTNTTPPAYNTSSYSNSCSLWVNMQ